MTRLTIDADGQITLTDEHLRHLGLDTGGQLNVDFLPDGTLSIERRRSRGEDLTDTSGAIQHSSQKASAMEKMDEPAPDSFSRR
jgi:bifunctional DNA-binding transcriptional regulator/antitoxin component of YhaV-PrlF toxin-antitoxin module